MPAKPSASTPIGRYRSEKKKFPNSVGILVEGDSWFAYPPLLSTNIPKVLNEHYTSKAAFLDRSANGDDAREMLSGSQYDKLYQLLAEKNLNFDAILFSGGGNDIAARNLPLLLKPYQAGYSWEDCLHLERFSRRLKEIEYAYLDLADLRDTFQPQAVIFTHSYDYAIPTGKGVRVFGLQIAGDWLKTRFDDLGIPAGFQGKLLDYMLAEFDNLMLRLDQTLPKQVHIRTQGTLKESDWANELHPTSTGFQKISKVFQQALEKEFGGRLA